MKKTRNAGQKTTQGTSTRDARVVVLTTQDLAVVVGGTFQDALITS